MKPILTLIVLFLALQINAQNYNTHTVQQGETIKTIAKQYLVTASDIYALNPDAKTKLSPNTVLIIPNSKVKNQPIASNTKTLTGFKKHKVRRKETLYSLSKKYDISIDDIKKHNRFLYANNLKKGDRLQIPNYKTEVNTTPYKNTIKPYTVQPTEGKWRIAYKFGITVPELEALNPNIKPVIQPGDVLNVPNIAAIEEKPTSTTHNYYEVLPAEGFFRLKIKLGLTQQQLEALNPELKTTGLKAGMVLKLPPTTKLPTEPIKGEIVNLTKNISNFSTKQIAVLMPYQLHKIDVDSVEEAKDRIKNSTLLSAMLDFHSGMLMAVDSAKQLGISVNIDVFDTQFQPAKARQLIKTNDFSKYNAVIGPVKPEVIDVVAMETQSLNTPLILPINKPNKPYKQAYQTVPDDAILKTKLLNFVKADSLKNHVLILADRSHISKAQAIKTHFPSAEIMYSRKNKKTGKDDYFIYKNNLQQKIKAGKTVVFLETTNNAFASTVISMLNGLAYGKNKLQLVTTNKNKAFDANIDNVHLSNLNFHYPSVNCGITAEESTYSFIKTYKKIYGVYPNRYAVRGFDIMFDVLLRLSSSNTFYDSAATQLTSEHIENRFKYVKSPSGGYKNEAVYIVKYNNLRLQKVN